jgi:signal transduction histidine kinase
MNLLPRYLALGLFVVSMALVALLVVPFTNPDVKAPSPGSTAPLRVIAVSQRLALGLGICAAAFSLTLVLSLAMRAARAADSQDPFASARSDIGTLARLAESTNAQGAELNRERDVRRRAEEDAQLKQQLLAQAFDEKIRLGRDLHDGIIQSLYAVGLTLESVRQIVHNDPAEADRRLESIRAQLNNAIRDVRAYITGLTPTNLRRAGFAHAVSAMLNDVGAGHSAEFDIKIDDEAATLLTPEQSVEALQIAREAVSNALRHGAATRVTLRVHQSDREVCMLIQDNGRGFNASTRREGGHGMGNMQARAERIGATLRVTSQPGDGARVLATLPILQASAA